MYPAARGNEPDPEEDRVRHALMHERACAHHYRTVLANARDRQLRGRCRRQLHASLGRAVSLALSLVDMGGEVPSAHGDREFDAELLEAMEQTLQRGARSISRRAAAGTG